MHAHTEVGLNIVGNAWLHTLPYSTHCQIDCSRWCVTLLLGITHMQLFKAFKLLILISSTKSQTIALLNKLTCKHHKYSLGLLLINKMSKLVLFTIREILHFDQENTSTLLLQQLGSIHQDCKIWNVQISHRPSQNFNLKHCGIIVKNSTVPRETVTTKMVMILLLYKTKIVQKVYSDNKWGFDQK